MYCNLITKICNGYQSTNFTFYTERGGNISFRKVGTYLPSYTTSNVKFAVFTSSDLLSHKYLPSCSEFVSEGT